MQLKAALTTSSNQERTWASIPHIQSPHTHPGHEYPGAHLDVDPAHSKPAYPPGPRIQPGAHLDVDPAHVDHEWAALELCRDAPERERLRLLALGTWRGRVRRLQTRLMPPLGARATRAVCVLYGLCARDGRARQHLKECAHLCLVQGSQG